MIREFTTLVKWVEGHSTAIALVLAETSIYVTVTMDGQAVDMAVTSFETEGLAMVGFEAVLDRYVKCGYACESRRGD